MPTNLNKIVRSWIRLQISGRYNLETSIICSRAQVVHILGITVYIRVKHIFMSIFSIAYETFTERELTQVRGLSRLFQMGCGFTGKAQRYGLYEYIEKNFKLIITAIISVIYMQIIV